MSDTPPSLPNSRPRLSLRSRILAGFLFCFLLAVSITLISYYLLLRLQGKLQFLEVADNLVLELQQARRFEKNFLLYGTNLAEAQAHVHAARQLFRLHAGQLAEVAGPVRVQRLQEEIQEYSRLLEACGDACRQAGTAARRPQLEAELRQHGAAVLQQGLLLVQQERQALARMFRLAQQVPLAFLVFLFCVMAILALKLSRQILGPLARLKQFAQQVTQGETAPMAPVSPYQDELADLTQALQTMVSELQRRQELLAQTAKLRALGTLVAGIAHELNNPITNIVLTVYSLREEEAVLSPADRQVLLQDLLREAERLKDIVGNLLDYARESEFTREPVALPQLLQETLLLVGRQLKLAGIRLEVETAPALPPVWGDRRQLRQVLVNLLLNAVEAIGQQGTIHVILQPQGTGAVTVTIQDNGPGIPAPILPYIFDPFFTTKPVGQGTGLGLAVSQGIITRHGGTIQVTSQPGQGTTFTITLPAAAPSTAGARVSQAEA